MEIQPKRRLSLTLSNEVFDGLRRVAFDTQRNLNEVIETALRKYAPIKAKLNGKRES